MRVALLGDIALFGCYSKSHNGSLELNLQEIANYLQTFDYVVGNLETPFSIKKKTHGAKSAYICSDVENLQLLKSLHIDAVTLANNHIFDYGFEGYELTKSVLDDAGIEWFGVEGKVLKKTIAGNRIAFSGYCCFSANPLHCVTNGQYGVNAYNLKDVKECMMSNHNQGYLNIVAVHAGIEHVNYPSIEHIRAARQLSSEYPYVYYGHHPHVIQGVEKYHGALIAHSLGNFCFDNVYSDVSSKKPLVELTENNRKGMILELTVEKGIVITWQEQLIYITKDGCIQLIEDNDATPEYNNAITTCETDVETYERRRRSTIDNRIAARKAMRNFSWYLRRLRPRYARLILNARRNAKLFRENVVCQIKK